MKINCNFNTFCPRRATEGHGEGQGQLQERQLQKVNGNCNFFLSAKGREEHLSNF